MYAKKRKADLSNPPPKRRKSKASAIEEISFDPDARQDYLTGFHKRKLQRAKYAREQAMERGRLEKIEARKNLRENRKAEVERHVNEVNAMLREAEAGANSNQEEESLADSESRTWNGVEENSDHKDNFTDDDRHTTVIVEAVDITRDGLHKVSTNINGDDEQPDKDTPDLKTAPAEGAATSAQDGRRVWTNEPQKGPKKRRKKFRYETKAERKLTRHKEKSGNKAKAKSRRS